jgi:hypothetical protein
MENLTIFNNLKEVPPAALKPILAGRLKGKSDINPVWRIKALTEQFGPCGVGWKYEITDKQLHPGANGEIAAFVDINLLVKYEGEWSAPIPGTGGSMFVAKEKSGHYVNDEAFKMALTDAIGVAGKALGLAASIYWEKGESKYDRPGTTEPSRLVTVETLTQLADRADQVGMSKDELRAYMQELFKVTDSRKLTIEQAAELDSKLIEKLEGKNG